MHLSQWLPLSSLPSDLSFLPEHASCHAFSFSLPLSPDALLACVCVCASESAHRVSLFLLHHSLCCQQHPAASAASCCCCERNPPPVSPLPSYVKLLQQQRMQRSERRECASVTSNERGWRCVCEKAISCRDTGSTESWLTEALMSWCLV